MRKFAIVTLIVTALFSCALAPDSEQSSPGVTESESGSLYMILNDSYLEAVRLVDEGAAVQVISDRTGNRAAHQQKGWVVEGDEGYFTLVEECAGGEPQTKRLTQTFYGYKKEGLVIDGIASFTLTKRGEKLYDSSYCGLVTLTAVEKRECSWELKMSADLGTMTFTVEGQVGGYPISYN